MKKLFGLCFFVFVFCCCGEEGSVNLDDGASNYVRGTDGGSCNEEFLVSMTQATSKSLSTKITFVANTQQAAAHQVLDTKATVAQRCSEIRNHFSGRPINSGAKLVSNEFSLELSFSTTAEQEEQMLLGKSVELRAQSAYFKFTDGSLDSAASSVEIRCPGLANVSCQVTEIGDYKKCDSYNVTYSDTCTFRGSLVSFDFSDLKGALLDVSGELHLNANAESRMKFTTISWMVLI